MSARGGRRGHLSPLGICLTILQHVHVQSAKRSGARLQFVNRYRVCLLLEKSCLLIELFMIFAPDVNQVLGGAVQVWGNGSRIEGIDCVFHGNTAIGVEFGSEGSSTSLGSLTGTGETSSSSSGGTDGPVATIDIAGAAGGAIAATDGGLVFLTRPLVTNNGAEGRGGGVYCNGVGTNATLIDVQFEASECGSLGSTSGNGGAGAAVNGCLVSLMIVVLQAISAVFREWSFPGGVDYNSTILA